MRADPYFEKAMRGSALFKEYQDRTGYRPIHRGDQGFRVLRRDGDGCIFLDSDSLCKVHAQHGMESKPLACRLFPFAVTPTPDGYFVRLSHYCTAVKQNSGRPASVHIEELTSILERIEFQGVGFEPILLAAGTYLDWGAFKRFEAWILETAKASHFKQAFALALSLAAEFLEQAGTVSEATIEERLQRPVEDRVSANPFVNSTVNYGTVACIARLAASDFEHCQRITEALWDGGELTFPDRSWTGSTKKLLEVASRTPYHEMIDRYYRSLLHGKQLAEARTVFTNLLVYYRISDWIAFYAALSCLERGEETPTAEDIAFGIDQLESHILTHGRSLDDLHEVISDSVLQQLLYKDMDEAEGDPRGIEDRSVPEPAG